MTAFSHRFRGQGQLAAESCQNALGTLSVVSCVLFFYEKLPFFFFFSTFHSQSSSFQPLDLLNCYCNCTQGNRFFLPNVED